MSSFLKITGKSFHKDFIKDENKQLVIDSAVSKYQGCGFDAHTDLSLKNWT